MTGGVDTRAGSPLSVGGRPLDEELGGVLRAEFPGLATAIDPAAMAVRLEDALLNGSTPTGSIRPGGPGRFTYLPGDRLILRCAVRVADGLGEEREAIVTAHLFSRASDATDYVRHRLEPLARRAIDHPARSLPRSVAALDDLHMAVAVFPVDGSLPTLVDAANPRIVAGVLEHALGTEVRSCTVGLGHYGRQHRCVLRYDVAARNEGGASGLTTVYGKVAADDRGAIGHNALRTLQAGARRAGLRLPRSLGFVDDLRLLLLESIPGEPIIGRLLATSTGDAVDASHPNLEEAIGSSGRLLAVLHASAFERAPRRDAAAELARLTDMVDTLARVTPSLGRRLTDGLGTARALLGSVPPLRLGFAHGDFSHGQVVFDGARAGVLDFDTVCLAEPALDVGHFVANLGLAAAKLGDREQGRRTAERLGTLFVDSYLRSAGLSTRDAEPFAVRARAYEIASMVRLGVHSWQKLKTARLERVLEKLEERL